MKNTTIEWATHTFNGWIGCTKVSPGCANCYAATQDKFRKWTPEGWGAGKPRKRTSVAYWRQPERWQSEAVVAEFAWLASRQGPRPTAPRVFCSSLADWLDDEVPGEWLADLLDLIRRTPHLDWLLLTKRPENWWARMEAVEGHEKGVVSQIAGRWLDGQAPPNVWIGTTVEDQRRADQRLAALIEIPARVQFLSCEPLLGSVDLSYWLADSIVPQIDWVICGGESGPGARPMHPDWARSLRDQCASVGVPFFFKQWGEWAPVSQPGDADEVVAAVNTWPKGDWFEPDGTCGTHKTWDCVMIDRVGKKAAGRLLDGVEHSGVPVIQGGAL